MMASQDMADEELVIIGATMQKRVEEYDAGEEEEDEEEDDAIDLKNMFDKILNDLRYDKIDMCDPAQFDQFVALHDEQLWQSIPSNQCTLLHQLVDVPTGKSIDKYAPLVKYLIGKDQSYLSKKDSHGNTALHYAIHHKRYKLARLMCKVQSDVSTILGIVGPRLENCFHVAIRCGSPKFAIHLIQKATEEALFAKDEKGRTPLHLAVDYEFCTDGQLEVVTELLARCDKALVSTTAAPEYLSPYRYHEYTRGLAEEREARAKEKEKEHAQRQGIKEDNIKSTSNQEKDALSGKNRDLRSATPSVKPREPDNRLLKLDAKKNESTIQSSMNIEPPNIRYGNAILRGNTAKSSGIAAEMGVLGKNDEKVEPSKISVTAKEISNQTDKDEVAAKIKDYLKLHCMRTRNHDVTVEFLYGINQEKQIYFDLYGSRSETVSKDSIERGLAHLSFENILQYVALPCIRLEKAPIISKLGQHIVTSDSRSSTDMVFFFEFLWRKGVRRIIQLIVDDSREPSHSDETIEKAIGRFKVEFLDWRKTDLCTETIVTGAPHVRQVCLYWSGNNAVLRGWSEPGGLNQLTKLEKVDLHAKLGLETPERTNNNIREFKNRLKLQRQKLERPELKVEVIKNHQPEQHNLTGGPIDSVREQAEHRHKWLNCMDAFAIFIQNVQPPEGLEQIEPVTLALIDDGFDINEQSVVANIIGGRSFCQREKTLSEPYYVTSGGHGTVMASLICRICPTAQIYVVKLDEYINEKSERQITAKSAAKAVRAAIDKHVQIISMSWTIERTQENASDIADLESAIEAAAKKGILMFCAASDQGAVGDHSFPYACGGTKHLFKIGAAGASGTIWKWVGEGEVDFIFPGQNIVMEQSKDASMAICEKLTGSSVATALAAGLAALILYCFQLSALNTQACQARDGYSGGSNPNAVTMDDFKAMMEHERMKEAFLAIGTSRSSGNKYLTVWDCFEPAMKNAEGLERERRIERITTMTERLKLRKTFEYGNVRS